MWTFPILEKLGGLDAVFARLKARDFPIKTRDALRMWRNPTRGVIPGEAVVELMRICEEEGVKYSADDFKLVRRTPATEAA
ncbi:MAG: hypothetical protein AB7H90_01060 [Alphaproteobacteria bacterium]